MTKEAGIGGENGRNLTGKAENGKGGEGMDAQEKPAEP